MYKNRLVCDDDAVRGLKTLAALVAGYGQPAKSAQPSLLRRQRGLEFMVWNRTGPVPVWAWAEGALEQMLGTVPTSDIDWQLTRRQAAPTTHAIQDILRLSPGQIQFDPNRCDASGEFVTYSALQIAQHVFHNLDKAGLPQNQGDTHVPLRTRALEYLATSAYLQHGPALLHHIRKTEWHFCELAGPISELNQTGGGRPFDLENSIIFMTVLVQVAQQKPLAQIIPLFGSQVNRTRSEKIHRAVRQIQAYQPELKLIRLMKGPRRSEGVNSTRTASTPVEWSQDFSAQTFGT